MGDLLNDTNSASAIGTLFRPVRPGDANGDGQVDINDLTIVLSNFGKTGMAWGQGEFTGQRHGGHQRPDDRAEQLRHVAPPGRRDGARTRHAALAGGRRRGSAGVCAEEAHNLLTGRKKGTGTICAKHPRGPFRQMVPVPLSSIRHNRRDDHSGDVAVAGSPRPPRGVTIRARRWHPIIDW